MTTREVIVSESTLHPNSALVEKQADLFADQTAGRDEKPSIVMHDKDTKFTKGFVDKLKSRGVRTNSLPKASPNLNGRCERFIETIKLECLSKFIMFGEKHLDYLVSEFTSYYNTRRWHMEREHLPPVRQEPEEVNTLKLDQVEVKSYVGGLVKSFDRKAPSPPQATERPGCGSVAACCDQLPPERWIHFPGHGVRRAATTSMESRLPPTFRDQRAQSTAELPLCSCDCSVLRHFVFVPRPITDS